MLSRSHIVNCVIRTINFTKIEKKTLFSNNKNNRLDSVDATDTSPTSDRYFAYDANGNLKSDNERNISDIQYHRKNYPYSITTSTADISYLYNAADLRIFKYVETATDTLTEYYLRNSSGQELGIYTADGDSTWAWYVYGAERIGKIVPETDQLPENTNATSYNSDQTFYVREDDTLYHTEYYFTDHLGNTRIVYKGSSDNSSITREVSYMADYYPFGKVLREYSATGDHERYLTTQHERDDETSYDYRGARFYDSDLGRFLSLDPMQTEYPSMNAYHYVASNPILFIDPDGKKLIFWGYRGYLTDVLNMLNDGVGINDAVSFEGTNKGKLVKVRDLTEEEYSGLSDQQKVFYDELKRYADPEISKEVKIEVRSKSEEVLIGHFGYKQIDIFDISKFGVSGEVVNMYTVLLHEIAEQYSGQAEDEGYGESHFTEGYSAEEKMTGYTRSPEVEEGEELMDPDDKEPTGYAIIKYTKGEKTYKIKLFIKNRNIIKVDEDDKD